MNGSIRYGAEEIKKWKEAEKVIIKVLKSYNLPQCGIEAILRSVETEMQVMASVSGAAERAVGTAGNK